MSLRPSSRDVRDVRVAAGDDPRVGPGHALDGERRVEVGRQAARLAARRAVAGEHHDVARPEAPLRGQRAQEVELLVAQLVARPLGGRLVRARDLVEPREGGRVVAIGDRDVGVARDDRRAGRVRAP